METAGERTFSRQAESQSDWARELKGDFRGPRLLSVVVGISQAPAENERAAESSGETELAPPGQVFTEESLRPGGL